MVYLFVPSAVSLQTITKKCCADFVGPLVINRVLDETHYILSDLQGRILCGVYHVRRLKKAQLRTPIGNITTYDELKTTFQETNADTDNMLPNISDAALAQSLVALNCYKCSTCTEIYSIPWIFLIVLLSMLVNFALYWIFVLIIRPFMSKSNTCRYIFPCYRSHTDFLNPSTDMFLDIVHVNSGEQIRVYLTTIAAPACSLSFTGSVKISNFRLTKKNLLTTLYID